MQTRRNILKLGLTGAATLFLPGPGFLAPAEAASAREDPHFFLMVLLNGGADTSYMFDARPLAMTAAGKIQNYRNEEPQPWEGRNGFTAPATSLVKPLAAFKDRLCVLNGVVMIPSFDGHAQNMNFLFTGSPFGGEDFVPHLNLPDNGLPPVSLDAIIPAGPVNFPAVNHGGVIPLTPGALHGLPQRLKELEPPKTGDELTGFVRARLAENAKGTGRLSGGAGAMLSALDSSPEVYEKLKQLVPTSESQSQEQQCVALMAQCFRLAISRAAIYVLPEQFDTHAPGLAKAQPKLFASAIGRIAALLQGLSDTPFDATRSMFDVTTVMVASEFGRSLRAPGLPIDGTGTNHNQYASTVLLGGKGVRGGMVIGATDMTDAAAPVSKAHLAIDPALEKAIGRPFDFSAMVPRTGMPEAFDAGDYLTISSVVNTVYSLFSVPKPRFRTMARDGQPAPVLHGMLS